MQTVLALLIATFLGQQGPPDAKQVLQEYGGFSKKDAARIDAEVVVKQLGVEESASELAILGAVHIDATPGQAVEAFRDIETYLKTEALLQIGVFSDPPQASDLAAFTYPNSDIEAFQACNEHACKVKLSEAGLEAIEQIDWNAADAHARADALFRSGALDYIQAYQRGGNAALITYADKGEPMPLADGLDRILRQVQGLPDLAPEVFEYLRNYPADAPDGLESFKYWVVEDYGYRPTIMLVHAFTFQRTGETMLGQKTIYASHYFQSRFEMTWVVEAPQGGSYLVYSDRSVFDDQLKRVQRSLLGRGVTANVKKRLESIRERARSGGAE